MKKKILEGILIICCLCLVGCDPKKEEDRQVDHSNTDAPQESSSSSSSSEENIEDNEYIVDMSIEEFIEKTGKEESFYVAIVQDGCGGCEAYKPVLSSFTRENKKEVYMINLTKENTEQRKKLIEGWTVEYTPTTFKITNGAVDKKLIGAQAKENLISFFK